MTLYGASLIFTLLFLGGVYIAVARKVWRGESGLSGDRPPEWWFLGPATWRGVARAYIATVPFGLVIVAGAMIAELGGNEDLGMTIAALALLAGARRARRASCCSTARARWSPRTCATSPARWPSGGSGPPASAR